MIAALFGASAGTVDTGQAIYLALLLELISGPGLWAIWTAALASPRSRAEGSGEAKTVSAAEAGTIIVDPAPAPVQAAEDAPSEASDPKADAEFWSGVEVKGSSDDEPRDPPPSGSRPDPKTPRLGEMAKRHELAPAAPAKQAPAARGATIHQIKPKARPEVAEASPEQIIEAWAAECITHTGDVKRDRPSAGDCIASLNAYCEREGAEPIDQQKMTAVLNEILAVEKAGKRWPRNSKERIWPGYRVEMPEMEQLRASA